jgi:hypothetical protein
MVLQCLHYRTSFETSVANGFRIVELHRRDTAVFVSLSSRTNTRWGVLVRLPGVSHAIGIETCPLLLGLVAQLVRARA